MPGMSSTVYDLTGPCALEKGVSWALHFTRFNPDKTPVDLTGASARLEIYDALASGPPLLVLSSANPTEIVLGGAAGTFAGYLSAAASAAFTATNLRYRLFFTVAGVDQLYLRGRIAFIEDDE